MVLADLTVTARESLPDTLIYEACSRSLSTLMLIFKQFCMSLLGSICTLILFFSAELSCSYIGLDSLFNLTNKVSNLFLIYESPALLSKCKQTFCSHMFYSAFSTLVVSNDE